MNAGDDYTDDALVEQSTAARLSSKLRRRRASHHRADARPRLIENYGAETFQAVCDAVGEHVYASYPNSERHVYATPPT